MDYDIVIECHIYDEILLYPCDNDTTVTSLAEGVFKEYNTLMRCKNPMRIKYVREKENMHRILSGNMKIISHNVSKVVEIVMEDWNEIDTALEPAEIIDKYRLWQIFASNQIVDYVKTICDNIDDYDDDNKHILVNHKTIKIHINSDIMMQLLNELLLSPCEDVLLVCLQALYLLQTRFVQKELYNHAVISTVKLFNKASSSKLAIAALKNFYNGKKASQFYDIDKKVIKAIHVDDVCNRLSDGQGDIIKLYENIVSRTQMVDDNIITDSAIDSNSNASATHYNGSSSSNRLNDNYDDVDDDVSALSQHTDVYNTGTATPTPTVMSNNNNNGIQLSRLLTLLSSEDPAVKAFALDKVNRSDDKRLIAMIASNQDLASLIEALMLCLQSSLHSRAAATTTATATCGSEVVQAAVSSWSDNNDRSIRRANSIRSMNTNGSATSFQSIIGNQYKNNGNSNNNDSNDRAMKKNAPVVGEVSTAETLITSALQSPMTQFATVTNVIKAIVYLTSISDDWKSVAYATLKSWIRLLVTLSHAPMDDALAESAAALSIGSIASSGGWSAGNAKLENTIINKFLSYGVDSIYAEGAYTSRIDLAMSYLQSLSQSYQRDSITAGGDASTHGNNGSLSKATSKSSMLTNNTTSSSGVSKITLEDVLLYYNSVTLKTLWKYACDECFLCIPNRTTLQSNAMECIATAAVSSTIRRVLVKMEAVGKIILLLLGKLSATDGASIAGSRSYRDVGVDVDGMIYLRSCMKALVNLSTADAVINTQICTLLSKGYDGEGRHCVSRPDEISSMIVGGIKSLKRWCRKDDQIGYYYSILFAPYDLNNSSSSNDDATVNTNDNYDYEVY